MSKGNESMDEHEELVDGGWIAERMGIARPSVARIMARLGVPRVNHSTYPHVCMWMCGD